MKRQTQSGILEDNMRPLMEKTLRHYKDDFEIDLKILTDAAQSETNDDKTLIWLTRECGTHMFTAAELFIEGSAAYNTLLYWKENAVPNKRRVYLVKITGLEDGKPIGEVTQLSYAETCREVENKAIPFGYYSVLFEKGERTYIRKEKWMYADDPELGKFVRLRSMPKNDCEIKLLTILASLEKRCAV